MTYLAAPTVLAGGEGVFDTINNLAGDAEVTITRVVFVIILIVVAATIWKSRGGIAAIASALVMAAVVWWAFNNIDFLEGEVDDTITSAPGAAGLDPNVLPDSSPAVNGGGGG